MTEAPKLAVQERHHVKALLQRQAELRDEKHALEDQLVAANAKVELLVEELNAARAEMRRLSKVEKATDAEPKIIEAEDAAPH